MLSHVSVLTEKEAENCLPVFAVGGNGTEIVFATEILTYVLSSPSLRYLPLFTPSLPFKMKAVAVELQREKRVRLSF